MNAHRVTKKSAMVAQAIARWMLDDEPTLEQIAALLPAANAAIAAMNK